MVYVVRDSGNGTKFVEKLSPLQFLVVDEVEAVGINLMTNLAMRIQECSSRPFFFRKIGGMGNNINK
eukprot:1882198-Karenia_brevis.AAC.1